MAVGRLRTKRPGLGGAEGSLVSSLRQQTDWARGRGCGRAGGRPGSSEPYDWWQPSAVGPAPRTPRSAVFRHMRANSGQRD
jgi:hypothetical protein